MSPPVLPGGVGLFRAGTGSSHQRNGGISTADPGTEHQLGQESFLKSVPWDGDVPTLRKGISVLPFAPVEFL